MHYEIHDDEGARWNGIHFSILDAIRFYTPLFAALQLSQLKSARPRTKMKLVKYV